jgi:Na+-driven multidrug efflux pump
MAVDVVKDKKKDMTNDVRKMSLFKLAWPVFVQCLLSLCLGYVDTLMISRYSSTAVGGLGNANQILGFLTLAFTVISSAAGVIIAQYIGAGLKNKLSEIYIAPLSYKEFKALYSDQIDDYSILKEYIAFGGMPELKKCK